MTGKTICVLSDSCATPVVSGLKKFRNEFEAKIGPDHSRGHRTGTAHVRSHGRCMSEPSRTEDGELSRSKAATVVVPEGTSILEAAKTAGVLIPHYCYHPGLPVAGVCRMCLVEVEKLPKLAPACATTVMEGQVVHVHSREGAGSAQGRARVPAHQSPARLPDLRSGGRVRAAGLHVRGRPRDSRYREPKRFNPVEDFGGDVLYVQNRCILCTRCVRFMDDVAQDPVLNVSRARRPRVHRQGRRARPDARVGRQRGRPVPGRRAALEGLPEQGARVGARSQRRRICTGCSQGATSSSKRVTTCSCASSRDRTTAVNQLLHVRVGRLDYRDSIAATAPTSRWCAQWRTACSSPTGKTRIDAAAASAGGQVASLVLSPRRTCRTKRCSCSSDPATHGRHRRVSRGARRRSSACRRADLALRAERAANATGARLLGFTEVATSLDGSSTRRRRAARCRRRSGATAGRAARRCERPRIVCTSARRCRCDRCARRVALPITNTRRRRRHAHQPAWPRAAIPAGRRRPRRRASELVRARRPVRSDSGGIDASTCRPKCSRRLPATHASFAGCRLRRAWRCAGCRWSTPSRAGSTRSAIGA